MGKKVITARIGARSRMLSRSDDRRFFIRFLSTVLNQFITGYMVDYGLAGMQVCQFSGAGIHLLYYADMTIHEYLSPGQFSCAWRASCGRCVWLPWGGGLAVLGNPGSYACGCWGITLILLWA